MKWFTLLLVAACSLVASAGSFTITVVPSLGPNGLGSMSFGMYQSNAIHALESGLTSYGDPTSPTYYQQINGPLAVSQNIVTGFNSWMGNANATGNYGNEYGNRVLFGVDITSSNTQFSISQLSFNMFSTDPGSSLGYSFAEGSYNYNDAYVGINYGVDGIKGTSDDIRITSGPNTQLVDEIVGRGSGNAWDAYDFSPGATRQDKIDMRANGVWSGAGSLPFSFTGTYSLSGSNTTGSGTVVFDRLADPIGAGTSTPLPGAAAGGGVLFMFGLFRRNRRRR